MDVPSPSVLPTQEPNASDHSNPKVEIPLQNHGNNDDPDPVIINEKKKIKRVFKDVTAIQPSSSSSSSSSTSVFSSAQRSTRFSYKSRSRKIVFAPVRRRGRGGSCRGGFGDGDVEAIAFLLGMSFAAVVAQVLERKDAAGQMMSVDHLSVVCTSAVKESLANVFGDKFDFFARNFEKSFGSTLSTLRLIYESSINKGAYHLSHQHVQSTSDVTLNRRVGCPCSSGIEDCHSEADLPTSSTQSLMLIGEEVEENASTDCFNQEYAQHGQINQLACIPRALDPSINQLSTFEKSVMEQARSNDLKEMEVGLKMRNLKLKEAQLALKFDSNQLGRSKLAMGISKASFKAEKFKSELEDTRHAELLKKCIDCLVAGLFIMSASLLYGTYVHSYKRITEATASCTASLEESKSWWMPKPFSAFNSGMQILKCQVQVVSRMLFGILMILAVAYLLLQRSAASRRTMPITFILLLLGGGCGFAGKLCVDTLGGSGSHWLLYWETLCLLQFFSNVCTSTLFHILYGPVPVSQERKSNAICPYWLRRCLFYAIVLLFLPLCCGLLPFASPGKWKDHFLLLAANSLWVTDD